MKPREARKVPNSENAVDIDSKVLSEDTALALYTSSTDENNSNRLQHRVKVAAA